MKTKIKGLALSKTEGFTLIELMVVIAVIAILATIALFGITRAQGAARDTRRQQIMNGIRTSLERYYGDNQRYPAGSFDNMMASLTTGGYLPATAPAVDPGCGTAPYTYPNEGQANPSLWLPCPVGSNVTYSYAVAGDGSTYSLVLYKEGGGSSVFESPK